MVSGFSTVVEVCSTITSLQAMSDSAPVPGTSPETRLGFETLIADASAALISSTPDDVDAIVETALERLRVFFGVDRVGLLRVGDDRNSVTLDHAAYGPGIPRVPPTIDLARAFPWSHRLAVMEQRTVVVPRVADLPPEAATDQATFRQFGVSSNLIVPIVSGQLVTHLMVLGSLRRDIDWPSDYLPRVRLLGEMFAGAILRARMLKELRAANDQLKQIGEKTELENIYLRREIAGRATPGLITGKSAAIRRAVSLASQVAATDATVLLTGETGTGKERFASFIHEDSGRRTRHMVRVNCSAIPNALIESELFGREKGAYTGALTRQIGRFELAHGSTLFLDEIGDMPLEVQAKLLRVLQERTIERLGSPTPIPVDVRIIAATNHDLPAAVRAGTFRSDLFYRLNVFPILVPPLRERRDDIEGLVEELVEELGAGIRKHFASVDRASLEALSLYDWPGNVRELRNLLERAMILCAGPTLKVHVPQADLATLVSPQTPVEPSSGGLREWERDHILRVLQDSGWRVRGRGGAAEVLGLQPTTLEKRMARLGIQRPTTRNR
jgi:formate hydrogenlyase transcriptional activator